MLVVDPGMHTAQIRRVDVDAAKSIAVTASDDKTVRIWSVTDGKLERTIRIPSGPGNIGKAFAVAIDPAGELVAVGGWTSGSEQAEQIYILYRATGTLAATISDLPNVVLHLAFAPSGRYLAVTFGIVGGLRVYDRDRGWTEVVRDLAYSGRTYGLAFSPDGRLATTAYDGALRLYDAAFTRIAEVRCQGRPFDVAFSPDASRLAVGRLDAPAVDLFDAHTFAALRGPDLSGIDQGDLSKVAWASDGTLFAGGALSISGRTAVFSWEMGGDGTRRTLSVGTNTVMGLRPLSGGDLLVAAADPLLGRFDQDGNPRWTQTTPLADFRDQHSTLAISADGSVIDFSFERSGASPVRFDFSNPGIAGVPSDGGQTQPPSQGGFPVDGWLDKHRPVLGGSPLHLAPGETARSLAVDHASARLVLGADWHLRSFSAHGEELWRESAPSAAWAVNTSGDGRLAIAAYADGTVRWHRLDNGREVLAFLPLADRMNWVAWTPEGFYAASPGAHGVLRWHVNQAKGQPSADYAVADIPGFYRPSVIPLVLRELETPRAIGLAVVAEQRRKVQLLTDSRIPPGARLHVVAIGISRYNERHGAHLQLKFAQQDAHDIVSALSGTQDALYGLGSRQYLADDDATRTGLLRAFAALRTVVAAREDLVVVSFSGHGAMVDGELFFLPHDVDARDVVALKATALPASVLRRELIRVAERSRVLVLLDACYSGAASLDGEAVPVASHALSSTLAAANVTVLSSSSASQTSREDVAWRNGAFTEALLEALGGEADENHDGLLSATELARYVDRRVRNLTGDRQQPAMEIRFDGTLFAVQ